MAGSVFDSALYGRLFPTGEAGRLFTDSAEIRAMLLVEGALAEAQGARGIIPELSARAIKRAAMEVLLDPAAMAEATGENGVSVPALVAAFRAAMNAPEHAQFVHWGATSQDILDTGLMLRLRQALSLVEADLRQILGALADLADRHADLPMAARTFGQHATPISFGAVAAAWGHPLLGLLDQLGPLRRDCLLVSLSGATGTASELGPDAPALRADLAAALGLTNPERGWHTDRTPILRIADWFCRLTLALGKLGEDAVAMTATGIGELVLGGAGSSSTMPQKRNPVGPSVLIALARQSAALMSSLHSAAMPRHQREGGAWFTEWMSLPQVVLCAASSTQTAHRLVDGLAPQPKAMAAALTGGQGMIHAEALSFALTELMPRPEAQKAVKALCAEAMDENRELKDLAARDFPALDVAAIFDPARQMGHAPDEARAFAAAARARVARDL